MVDESSIPSQKSRSISTQNKWHLAPALLSLAVLILNETFTGELVLFNIVVIMSGFFMVFMRASLIKIWLKIILPIYIVVSFAGMLSFLKGVAFIILVITPLPLTILLSTIYSAHFRKNEKKPYKFYMIIGIGLSLLVLMYVGFAVASIHFY